MTHETQSDDRLGIDVNTTIFDVTESSIEAAIKRAEDAPGALPDFDTYIRAGEAAEHLTNVATPCIFPRPEREASSGASSDYVPQRERLQNDEALAHREARSRQRVVDNASGNGGRL